MTIPTRANLTIGEVAMHWGVSTKTVRRLIAEGALPAYRIGSMIRVRAEDVEALARRVPTARRPA